MVCVCCQMMKTQNFRNLTGASCQIQFCGNGLNFKKRRFPIIKTNLNFVIRKL